MKENISKKEKIYCSRCIMFGYSKEIVSEHERVKHGIGDKS